jgi:chromosome segregation ATPase
MSGKQDVNAARAFRLKEQVKSLEEKLAAEVSARQRAEAALQTPDERAKELGAEIARLKTEISMAEQRRREAQATQTADRARIAELDQKLATVTLERDAARKDAEAFKAQLAPAAVGAHPEA